MGAKNSIDLDTDPRSIIRSRLLDAPRELVFLAFTEPRHLAQWRGPGGRRTQLTWKVPVRGRTCPRNRDGGADEGLSQTIARLADYLATTATGKVA